MSIYNTQTSRRALLKATAGLGAIVAVPMTLHGADVDTDDPASRAQKAFIEAVLHKHTGRSRAVQRQQVTLFARRFTEEYGVVDYRQMYSGIVGEYRLTRLFARSLHMSAA